MTADKKIVKKKQEIAMLVHKRMGIVEKCEVFSLVDELERLVVDQERKENDDKVQLFKENLQSYAELKGNTKLIPFLVRINRLIDECLSEKKR